MHKSNLFFLIFVNLLFIISIFAASNIFNPRSTTERNSVLNQSDNKSLQSNPSTYSNTNSMSTTSDIKQIVGLQWLLDQGFDGSGVTIGIVDTGIDYASYPGEFGSRVLAEKSFVTTSNN